MVDVSVIFVNYKTKDLTINAINSVIEKTKGISYEIFVVDNASNDGSIEAIEKEFPNINIIKNKVNGGFGYANNLAIKEAVGKYVFCLNTDTLLYNNAIKIMYDFMEQNSDVGVCGGSLLDENLNYTAQLCKFPRLFNFTIIDKQNDSDSKPIPVDWVCGADIFIRRKILYDTGLFDDEFFMYREEIDLCKRIKNLKYQIYLVPESKIIHFCYCMLMLQIFLFFFIVLFLY